MSDVVPGSSSTQRLDQRVAASTTDPDAWWRAAWLTLLVTVGFIVVLAIWSASTDLSQTSRAVISLVAEALLGAVVFRAASNAAGGLRQFVTEVGLSRPTLQDLKFWLAGIGLQFVALIIYTQIVLAIDKHAAKQSSNTTGLHHASALVVVLLILSAVVIAPLVEESQFRGLFLRAGMRRYGFLPAAIGTSLVFGALHGWQVHTVPGVLVLVGHLTVFALVQCWLVRRSGRLVPNVLVHASFNLFAVILATR